MPPKKQVPPGTRNARTGEYIRKPVRVQGGGKKLPNKSCPLSLLAFVGGVSALVRLLGQAKGVL